MYIAVLMLNISRPTLLIYPYLFTNETYCQIQLYYLLITITKCSLHNLVELSPFCSDLVEWYYFKLKVHPIIVRMIPKNNENNHIVENILVQ